MGAVGDESAFQVRVAYWRLGANPANTLIGSIRFAPILATRSPVGLAECILVASAQTHEALVQP